MIEQPVSGTLPLIVHPVKGTLPLMVQPVRGTLPWSSATKLAYVVEVSCDRRVRTASCQRHRAGHDTPSERNGTHLEVGLIELDNLEFDSKLSGLVIDVVMKRICFVSRSAGDMYRLIGKLLCFVVQARMV